MRPNWPSLRTTISGAAAVLLSALRRTVAVGRSAVWTVWTVLLRLADFLRARWGIAYRKATALISGPIKQFVYGPLRVVLLGQRRDVSILVALVSPVLALGTTWWVGSTVGYETVASWVRGTWFGTEPSLAVFLAVGGLIALGAICAAVNSGLLPTGLLVSAPIFGAAVTRYATSVTYTWGSTVVSLPNAVGVAIVIALAFGLPIAVGSFVLGSALRRVIRVAAGRTEPSQPVDNA